MTFPVSKQDNITDIPSKVISTHIKHLEDLLKKISQNELSNAINSIISAKTIAIFAVENSICVADDLRTKLTYMGFNVVFHQDPYLQKIVAKNLSKEDVAIAVSYTGSSRITVDALENAKKSNATTIAITNFMDTLINKYADIKLHTENEQYFYGNAVFSRCTQIALVDMIYTGILVTDYEKYSSKIENNSIDIKSFSYSS